MNEVKISSNFNQRELAKKISFANHLKYIITSKDICSKFYE